MNKHTAGPWVLDEKVTDLDEGGHVSLEKFVSTIDATGGVHSARHGGGPVGDPDWLDLGDAYHAACAALGRKPKVTRSAP